jgi:hypothetical protein
MTTITKKKNIKTDLPKKPKITPAVKIESRFKPSDLVILPLGFLVIICLRTLLSYGGSSSFFVDDPIASILSQPALMALCIAPFSILLIYKIIRRQTIPLVANIASLITAFIVSVLFVWLLSVSDSRDLFLKFAILFFNPFVAPVLIIVGLVGLIAFCRPKLKNT